VNRHGLQLQGAAQLALTRLAATAKVRLKASNIEQPRQLRRYEGVATGRLMSEEVED